MSFQEILDLSSILDKNIYFEDKKFKAPLLAGDIAFQGFSITEQNSVNRGFLVTKDDKKIWVYNDKYWQDEGEDIIKNITQKILQSASCTRHKQEVIAWIKDNGNIQIERDRLDGQPELIGLENGVFNVKTSEFMEHDPSYYLTSTLPIEYTKDALCPLFQQFLEDVLYEEDLNVIQEMFGYCFWKQYPIAILFFLIGEGRNGKSTLLSILSDILGKQNIANVPLQALCSDRFSSVDLYRKMANICGDLSPDELKRTGMIKMLTGQDYIRAQNKHEKAFKYVNYAKLIFAMNLIPECNDTTLAWEKRMCVIEFPNRFLEGDEKTDPFIVEKLRVELPGIFNWSMIGLKRLLETKKFSKHRNLNDVKEFIATVRNPVYQFVTTHIKFESGNEETKESIYSKFIAFCKENSFPTMASNQFSMQFKERGPHGLEEGQSRLKGGKKIWKNIKYMNSMDDSSMIQNINVSTDIQQEELKFDSTGE
jgi:putative DNA primase/helicase